MSMAAAAAAAEFQTAAKSKRFTFASGPSMGTWLLPWALAFTSMGT